MKDKFKVLQVGGSNLEYLFSEKKDVQWNYFDMSIVIQNNNITIQQAMQDVGNNFNFIFIQEPYSKKLIEILEMVSKPHNTFIDVACWNESFVKEKIVKNNLIKPLRYDSQAHLEEKLYALTFTGQYGDKLYPRYCLVNHKFDGDFEFMGNKYLILSGDFGEHFTSLLSWKNNIVCDKNKSIEIWPEYKIEGEVNLEYTFRIIKNDSESSIIEEIVTTQDELFEPIIVRQRSYETYLSVTVRAKGMGKIYIGAIHKRWSRRGLGQFILGGERYSDKNREEFFYYFNPGDMKPPLNVYFSGYRSQEGFEGFFMMERMKAPFLLISDPRVEGGAFYIGSKDYESKIQSIINEKLGWLNFKENDLILSGLSMGSFGALYYGVQLNPAAIIIGKPLVNVGSIAENMPLSRPEDFETSLDILLTNEQNNTKANIINLNNKFWNVMNKANNSQTVFSIAYMEHDDYDKQAFNDLLAVLSTQNARVISKAIPGRHNDDSATITNWFINFYHIILESQFRRANYEIG